jgi:hypothetical protein
VPSGSRGGDVLDDQHDARGGPVCEQAGTRNATTTQLRKGSSPILVIVHTHIPSRNSASVRGGGSSALSGGGSGGGVLAAVPAAACRHGAARPPGAHGAGAGSSAPPPRSPPLVLHCENVLQGCHLVVVHQRCSSFGRLMPSLPSAISSSSWALHAPMPPCGSRGAWTGASRALCAAWPCSFSHHLCAATRARARVRVLVSKLPPRRGASLPLANVSPSTVQTFVMAGLARACARVASENSVVLARARQVPPKIRCPPRARTGIDCKRLLFIIVGTGLTRAHAHARR